MASTETIFALSTAPGRAGVAVVRVSGPATADAVRRIAGQLPERRRATLRAFRDSAGELIDRGLLLWFPGPASFTGEDVAEFHVHGGRASVAGLLATLGVVGGLRPAEPGEFTRRAFEAGKMDLAETEALADLLDAETAAQRRQALRGLEDGIGRRADGWREQLIEAMALAEAEIDFPDEDDVPAGLVQQAAQRVEVIAAEIRAVLAAPSGERLREGAVIVIAGPPNAGKSSFLNRVAGREVAIVSPQAGTTRDLLEVALDLGGYPAVVVDTAGFRETDDPVEQEALRRARSRAERADLVLWFEEAEAAEARVEEPLVKDVACWRVRSKVDLVTPPGGIPASSQPGADCVKASVDSRRGAQPESGPDPSFEISALSGQGIDGLLSALAGWLATQLAPREAGLITRARHRAALEEALVHMDRATALCEAELFAEELRLSGRALGRISGRIDPEAVLDAVFASFCIGK